MLHVGEKVLT